MALMVDPRVAEVFVHSYSAIGFRFLYKEISEECTAYQNFGEGRWQRNSFIVQLSCLTRYSKHS